MSGCFQTPELLFQVKLIRSRMAPTPFTFEVINLPRNVIISTYPKEVKVVYQVALKDYNKIPENSFRVHCDL